MPYKNEHAARLRDPGKYKEFRRVHPKGYPEGVDVIFGITADGKTEMQAIRAKSDKLSLADFKRLLDEWDMKPQKLEPALNKGVSMTDKIELFSLWTQLDINKAVARDDGGESTEERGYISGVVSSDNKDLQGDTILQEGMEWDYFINRGWFNYEHQQGAENVLGVPTKVEATTLENGGRGTRVEGYLLLDKPKAREIYETAKIVAKASGGSRGIGYSVEGQVLERDPSNPKLITKSRILNVSVTAHPVNPDARLEVIARSLLDMQPEVIENVEKASVGYSQESVPARDSLSPLQPSNLSVEVDDDSMSEETSMSDDLDRMIRRIMAEEMGKMMSGEMEKLYNASKGVSESAASMVSYGQLKALVAKVFPSLPEADCKSFARKLLATAKSRYNN